MAIASANAAVQQLLLSHMGLGPKFNYRSLFGAPEFAALKYKQTLLTHACVTRSSPVVMDVLLFLSHTMSEALFHAELCLPKHLFALDHWANHLRQQQRSHQVRPSSSLHAAQSPRVEHHLCVAARLPAHCAL